MPKEEAKAPKVKADDDHNWVFVPGKSIYEGGVVHEIDNWAPSHTLDDLKKMVIMKGWSGGLETGLRCKRSWVQTF